MRTVSKEWKTSIREVPRKELEMEISIGLINQEAQSNGSITSPAHQLSDTNVFGKAKIDLPYATYEREFFKVNGQMLFPPMASDPSYYNGHISKQLSNENKDISGCTLELSFPLSCYPLDIKGLTLQFYWFYPTEFEIQWNDKSKVFINDGLKFITDFVFDSVSTPIKIIPRKMNAPYARFRVENIKFGIGLEFTSKEIIDATLTTYTHPISNNLPYKQLTFTVDDRDSSFDLENPTSSINFMEQMQQVKVRMGMTLENQTVEWLDMETLSLQEWISEKGKATFKACDSLTFSEEEYYKGQYYPSGITLYDLAINVLTDMGVESNGFELDTYLKSVKVKNPIPVCKYKEALQVIANAGRCYMSQDKDGKLYIMSNFMPEYEISSNDKMAYAKLQNVHDGTVTSYYATFDTHAMPIDGSMLNTPEISPYKAETGYASQSMSGLNGVFEIPPIIVIQAEARLKTFGLLINFGLTTATSFDVKTYRNNNLVESLSFVNADSTWQVLREWKEFDRMDIYIKSVEREHQRVYIDYIEFGDVTDYYISNNEYIETTPRGKLNTKVRNILVNTTNFSKADVEDKLVDKDVVYNAGQEDELITFSDPVYGLHADGCTILESGTYYVIIRKPAVKARTSTHITVYGKKYNVSNNTVSYQINPKGSDVPFENPLIDDLEEAYKLAEWIGEYVGEQKDYAFNWRGDPAVESNDILYIQNTFLPKMKLRVLKNTINYNGALSGSIEGRKVSDA